MMQLDDVVSSLTTGPRVEEAMVRSVPLLSLTLISALSGLPKHLANTTLLSVRTEACLYFFYLSSSLTPSQWRSIRWLDRCLAYHATAPPKPHGNAQTIFAILQGGLDPRLRAICCEEMVKRREDPGLGGIAIGGLSGGESKDVFWKM